MDRHRPSVRVMSTFSTTVRRKRDRQSDDADVLHEILREGLVAHVGVIRDGVPVVLPYLCGLGDLGQGPVLLLHGSTGGGLFLDAGPEGVQVCATVTHLDGIVFARSTHDSSANYRSAAIFGRATVVPEETRVEALWQVADHLMPGRREELREMRPREVAATAVLQVPLDTASVKVRSAGVGDSSDDGEDHSVWAGVLPLSIGAGRPQTSAVSCQAGTGTVSPSVTALAYGFQARTAAREQRLLDLEA